MEKLLEDAGIKLSSVASDIRRVGPVNAAGPCSTARATRSCWPTWRSVVSGAKIPELVEALTGRFSDHHAFLASMYLQSIYQRRQAITDLSERIDVVMEPLRSFADLITTIPGIADHTAEVIVAKTGADMSVFPTAAHFASGSAPAPAATSPPAGSPPPRPDPGTCT